MQRDDREEDNLSEASYDSENPAAGVVAGAVLVTLFAANHVRNFLHVRRKKRRRTPEHDPEELKPLALSVSDIDSRSDDEFLDKLILPSPRLVEGSVGFDFEQCASEFVSSNGASAQWRSGTVIERVKEMVYQRMHVAGGIVRASKVGSLFLREPQRQSCKNVDESSDDAESTSGALAQAFAGPERKSGGLAELL